MNRAGIFGGLAVLLALSVTARAGFVIYTDEAAFRAAAGAVQEIDFETLPDGSPSVDDTLITPEFNYGDQGVVFSSPFPTLFVGGSPGFFVLGSQNADTTARNWIIADLVTPATAVGVVFGGNTTLSVFDANNLLVGTGSTGGGGCSSESLPTSRYSPWSRTAGHPARPWSRSSSRRSRSPQPCCCSR